MSAAALGAGLTAPMAHTEASRSKSEKPNIIIFMPDQLRAESIACYGHPLIRTPNMDRLAGEGTRFDHCQCPYPVCTAARCSMLTGWYPHTAGHRTVYNLLKPNEPNLFKYLKQNGYDVYWYGKNDVLVHDQFGQSATEWDFFADGPEWSGADNPWPFEDRRYFSFLFKAKGSRTSFPDYARVQAAIKILEGRRQSKPFCIFLPLFLPHPPFTAPPDFYNMYSPQDVPPLRPAEFQGKPAFYEAIHRSRRLDKLSGDELRQINAVYLGMTSYMDWLLGELLDAVDRTKHRDDTAIIFCSDHGEWAGDYGLVEKWSAGMDDTLLRVPLIARMPGGAKGHVCDEPVELFDVMSTCLDLAGIEAQHTHFAHSLIPHLKGASGDLNRAVFSEGGYNTNEPHCFEPLEAFGPEHIYYPKIALENQVPETITRTTTIRTRRFKLSLRPQGTSELYDMQEDPRELNNVYEQAAYAHQQQDLQERMLNWYVRTSDVVPYGRDDRSLPKYEGI
jgi:choline-sulfatase